MIHKILKLARPLIIPDTETTGLNPQEARIVEIGFEIWDKTGLTKSWRTLVNPEIDIPKDAADTHHITDEMVRSCRECGVSQHDHPAARRIVYTEEPEHNIDQHGFKPWPTFKQLAPNLAKGFSNVDFAGKNIRYDLRVFAAEFDRAGVKWSYADAYIIDADRLEHLGEPRSLSHLYEKHTGRKLEGAHGALADVAASREVIEVQLQKYKDVLPHDLTALHDLQWPGYIDVDGKFKMINGVPTVAFGKWANKPMRNVEPSYWNWIIGADFSEDVKNIAREAKAGRFPMPPEEEHTL